MIVRMKHLDLLCVASDRELTLNRLRGLGAVHLDLATAAGEEVDRAKGDAADAESAVRAILKAREGRDKKIEIKKTSLNVRDVLAIQKEFDDAKSSRDMLAREIAKYEPYGDFDPVLAKKLLDLGIDLSRVATLPPQLPAKRLSAMKEDFARDELAMKNARDKIASVDEVAILSKFPALADAISFAAAKEVMQEKGAVLHLAGWIPATKADELATVARDEGWGFLMRDPRDGEAPPTLVEPPRWCRSMKALFEGLGIAPAYSEADVSVPFMAYFSLFFAMLVGDGAYGAIFLIATIAMKKKLPKSWFVMLTVFSIATVIWGTLSNTWFGAAIPLLATLPTVEWLADPSYNNMMLLCFTIGASHLIIARLWNAICKINDSTALAEFGWAGILLFMYFVTNSIVGIFASIPTFMYYVFATSLILVFGFSVKPRELKTRGAELGMLPLNIMSALGDIISYVRLFAVGLASVKVAENFNSMATGLLSDGDSWWVKALLSLAMVLILLVGHALNLAMAGLSILVHAVRLNTLEFSNHKGVSWSGVLFRPFKKLSNTNSIEGEKNHE